MRILGIETSCDDCTAALVEDGNTILGDVVASQIKNHLPFQGVVPEIASRLHTEWIAPVVAHVLVQAHATVADIDAVAVTNRPGLLGSLLVGVNFAKSLAATLSVPFIGIDHIRAHLYASQIEHRLKYPYLGLLVSGGHTVICMVHGYDELEVLGTTLDDAIGEAFDKVAKHYNLGYPGGSAIDRLAKNGDPHAFLFPGPSLSKYSGPFDISYSGLKTAAINQLELFRNGSSASTPENIAASFQRCAVNILMKRVRAALESTGVERLAAGGGVAANSLLREELMSLPGIEVAIPSIRLCTDNGAMVAALAWEYLRDGFRSDFNLTALARVTAFKKSSRGAEA